MRFVVILHGLPIFRFEARDRVSAERTKRRVIPRAYREQCRLAEEKRKERKR